MATRRISYFITLLLSIIGAEAQAYDIAAENKDGVTIYYNYINDGKELEVVSAGGGINGSYNGSVVIPEEVTIMNNARKVTSISSQAFWGQGGLTSVTIPNSVVSIGYEAFRYCGALTSVVMSKSVTSIGLFAFSECKKLASITIPEGLTRIEKCVFDNCSSLTSIDIPISVTFIGEGAFGACSNLNSLMIPKNVDSIGEGAFYGCSSLASITVDVENAKYDSRENCNGIIETETNKLILGCKNTKILNSVTSIGYCAFGGCTGLTSITIPNSVVNIEEWVFLKCDVPEVVSMIENPFVINTNTFTNNTYYNATLYVPEGTVDKYKATEGWKEFVFIKEIMPSSIAGFYCDGDEMVELKRYSLDGRVIKTPRKGINIIQMKNGTTKKVLVK